MQILKRTSFDSNDESAAYNKVVLRLLPYLILVLAIAFIDRLNVGFAKLQMMGDIGLSDVAYGMGAGIFFLGYCLFEIPANLVCQRVGIRRWLTLIMLVWGTISMCMMFVTNEHEFFILRFLLGVSEAGCYPGVMLFLTHWFPPRLRSQVSAMLFLGLTCAGFLGGPISGTIMSHLSGVSGLRGWQWLFLLEGMPAVLLGIFTYFYLTERPADAKWLSESERRLIGDQIARARALAGEAGNMGVSGAFRSGTIWMLAFANIGVLGASSCVGFWLPHVIKSTGVSDISTVGWLSAIPYVFSGVCMIAVARHSDATEERRWHAIAMLFVSLAGNVLFGIFSQSLPGAVLAMTLVVVGTQSTAGVIWTVPGALLTGRSAAVAISMVTIGGNLGGYFLPTIIGYVRSATGHIEYGFLAVAAVQFLGLVALATIPVAHFNRSRKHLAAEADEPVVGTRGSPSPLDCTDVVSKLQ